MADSPRKRGRPRGGADTGTGGTIHALTRAVDVLDALAQAGGLSLSELAARLDQSPSTLYRVLTTLEPRGIVELDTAAQSWHIGPAAFRIGATFLRRTGLVERSRQAMRTLMEDTGETANLGVEKGGQVVFVSQVETHESIRAFFPPGTQAAMHASGIGKALLGQYSEDRLRRFLSVHPLTRYTDQTITDAAALRAELAAIRRAGFALDNEERTGGMRCVAAPVFDQHGEAVAGISVSGPLHRMGDDHIATVGAKVVRVARELSRNLGSPVTAVGPGFPTAKG